MKYLLLLVALSGSLQLIGQDFNIGLKIQKTHTLYWENGVSAQYSFKNIKPDKLYFGFDYVSSRFGSALSSNALKQDRFIFSAAWYWRKEKAFRFFSKLNFGYIKVQLEEEFFSPLPSTATFFSPELGISYDLNYIPVVINLGSGFNFEQGESGTTPGTLLPLYYYVTLYYPFN